MVNIRFLTEPVMVVVAVVDVVDVVNVAVVAAILHYHWQKVVVCVDFASRVSTKSTEFPPW